MKPCPVPGSGALSYHDDHGTGNAASCNTGAKLERERTPDVTDRAEQSVDVEPMRVELFEVPAQAAMPQESSCGGVS